MSKSVAIITYSRAYNYGSALQAFALNKYLRNVGYEVKTIDYTTPRQQSLYTIFEPCKGALPIARNLHSILTYCKMRTHKKKFDQFLAANLPSTEHMTDEEMPTLNARFDYFVCGSDQIWNVQCDDFNPFYMLSFVSDKQKCIAYAPSLGGGADNAQAKGTIARYVTDFKALSSRETSSAELIRSATSKPVTHVLDPVFLLTADEWQQIAPLSSIVKHEYILGYFIGDVAGMRDYALRLSKQSGLPVVVIYKNLRDLKYPFEVHYDAGPADFVSLVQNARYVVTNSFHAVSFSLIFKKDFWAFVAPNSSDSRISSVVDNVGLGNRIVSVSSSPADLQAPIPYDTIDFSPLEAKIDASKQFLINNLR